MASHTGPHLLHVRAQVDGADRFPVQHDPAKELQVAAHEAMAVGQRFGGTPEGRIVTLVGDEARPVGRVDAGRDDPLLGTEGTEYLPRGARVPEGERRGAVVSNDLGQGGEVVHHGPPKRDQVVGDVGRAGEQEHGAARQHGDEGQLPLEGEIVQPGHADGLPA